MEIHNNQQQTLPRIQLLGYQEAEELLAIAHAHSQLPCKIIDDGCHERAEIVLKLAITSGIDPLLLRRAFVFNPKLGDYLSMPKPLIEPIKEWFQGEREAGRLVIGAKYEINETIFVVDDYGALRANAMPTIYLGDADCATWGVGHVAVMVGNYIVDTALNKPVLFKEWQAEMNLAGLIPLVGNIRALPELFIEELDQVATKKVAEVLLMVIADKFQVSEAVVLSKTDIASLYQLLDDSQKTAFFDLLFKEQIEAKGLYSREHWTEVYPGPLTSRGEDYQQFCPERRADIKEFLEKSSAGQRLDASLLVLKPFKDYERMILGYRFHWYAPEIK